MAGRYNEIKADILNKIKNKEYQLNKMLPTERELTEYYQASRMTVRRALDELIHDGVLIRRVGSGVYPSGEKEVRSIDKISFHQDQDLIKRFGPIKTKVIEIKTVKNHPICEKYLLLNEDEEVYQLKRVQYGQRSPLVYENIFFPKKYFKDIRAIDCTQSVSYIVKICTKSQRSNHNQIDIEAKLASQRLAGYLEITKGSPILQMTIIEKLDNTPLYCGVDSFDGNVFKYTDD